LYTTAEEEHGGKAHIISCLPDGKIVYAATRWNETLGLYNVIFVE